MQKSPFWGILTGCLTGVLLGLAFVAQFGWPWASLALAAVIGATAGWVAYDWQGARKALARAAKETMVVGMPKKMRGLALLLKTCGTLFLLYALASFLCLSYFTFTVRLGEPGLLRQETLLLCALASLFFGLMGTVILTTSRDPISLGKKEIAEMVRLLRVINPIALVYWASLALIWFIKGLWRLGKHLPMVLIGLSQFLARTILLFVKYTNEEGRRAAALATLFSLSIAMAVGAWLNENLVAYALVGLVLGPVVGHIEHKVYRALERRGRIEWALAKLGANKAD